MEQHHEHIQQLLDGELDQSVEQSLYSHLAMDSDLRNEMRDQLAMRQAVQEDRALLVPPAALTNSVFSSLGFAAPLAGAAAGAAGGSMLLQWLARLGVPVASVLAAAGLTLGVIQNSQTDTQTQAPLQEVQQANNELVGDTKQQIPTNTTAVTGPARTKVVYRNSPDIDRTIARLQEENARLSAENAQLRNALNNNVPTPQPVTSTEAPTLDARIASVNLHQTYSVQRTAEPSLYNMRSVATRPTMFIPGYSLQIRGMVLNPTQQTAADQQSLWYDNLGIAMQYRMNEHHSMYVEAANESYPMIFEGSRNGQQIRYEQYPTMFWAGIGYRYTHDQLGNSGVAPYGQVALAGSKYGPIGRLGTGIQYTPLGSISFLLGVETSSLAYSFQNQWFLSPKVGLTYGMVLRF